MAKHILITGATGRQGGAVINALLNRKPTITDENNGDFILLAVTRDISTPAAQKLASKSPLIKLVQGDLDDVPNLFTEARQVAAGEKKVGQDHKQPPIWGVFSVQVSMGKGVTTEGEVKQGKALIDEAIKEGVEHFVYSSVERGGDEASWENATPIPHFQTKHTIEHHLRDITAPGRVGESMGWTILRPVAFMDNLQPNFPTKIFLSALRNWLGSSTKAKPLQWISTTDIGNFTALVFFSPRSHNRLSIGLAGDSLTPSQMSRVFEEVTGRPAPSTLPIFGSALTLMAPELRAMIAWFASDGYRADIEARRKEYPGLRTFADWLESESAFEIVG